MSTAQRRGAIEHYYRAVVRPFFSDRDWKRLPRSGRQAISDSILQIIWDDVSSAIRAERSRRAPTGTCRTPRLALDEEGWEEMTKLLAGTLAEAEKIESRSAARLKESDQRRDSRPRVAMMQFESPTPEPTASSAALSRAAHAQES